MDRIIGDGLGDHSASAAERVLEKVKILEKYLQAVATGELEGDIDIIRQADSIFSDPPYAPPEIMDKHEEGTKDDRVLHLSFFFRWTNDTSTYRCDFELEITPPVRSNGQRTGQKSWYQSAFGQVGSENRLQPTLVMLKTALLICPANKTFNCHE